MMKTAAHKLQVTRFPISSFEYMWEAEKTVRIQVFSARWALRSLTPNSIQSMSVVLSQSYTHSSELSVTLRGHVTDSSSSLKDTFKPAPSWATHRSIHRLRATGLCVPALGWWGKAREKDTKRDSGEMDVCGLAQRSWIEEKKYADHSTAQQTRAGKLGCDRGGEWDETVFKHSLWCWVNLAASSTCMLQR